MRDDAVIEELGALASSGEEAWTARSPSLCRRVDELAERHERANRHWRAVALLRRARAAIAPRGDLDRSLALALGSKAELMLRWADALRVAPTEPLLAAAEADLRAAVAADPALADPRWDLALIAARFRGAYDDAAAHLADARALGYRHPAMGRLESLLGARPPLATVDPAPRHMLRQLVLELAEQARGPMEGLLREDDARPPAPAPRSGARAFGDYVRAARACAEDPGLSADDLLVLLDDSRVLTNDSYEHVADLLRRVAEARPDRDPRCVRLATERHLEALRDGMLAHTAAGERSGDAAAKRRALWTARRALAIVDASPEPVDADLHADLVLGEGAALWSLDHRNVVQTMERYRKGLRLKREAGNDAHVAGLTQMMWRQIDDRAQRVRAADHVAGIGEALEVLEACADAADELDDPDHALRVRLDLGLTQRLVSQCEPAEQNLLRVIAESSEPGIVDGAQIELASVYSETDRPQQAADLLEPLLVRAASPSRATAALWSNYANSLRLLDRRVEARDALAKAWAALPRDQQGRTGTTVPAAGARIKVLMAQIEQLLGNGTRALELLGEADALHPEPALGVQGLHLHRTRADILLALGRTGEALTALEHADHLLRFLLRTGPSYPTWESMLGRWSNLDASAIRALMQDGGAQARERALLQAEAAKGRVTAWLAHAMAPQGAERALDLERQKRALEQARRWLTAGAGRRVVSLFACDEGLAVFDLRPGADVDATWIDGFRYDRFRRERYEPWVRLVEDAMEGDDAELAERANHQTSDLLDEVGEWLQEGAPSLSDGGAELIIVPHRLFRDLPLLHARLPSGGRLSDRFGSVCMAPTLAHLVPEDDSRAAAPNERWSLADADGTLPFARCEALLAAPLEHCAVGARVTRAAIAEAFGRPAVIVLSLHGTFDERAPLRSRIFAADGAIALGDLATGGRIGAHAVVLGVCEAGRSRRSLSDEPWSFPALLLQQGARAVVAPAWPVDDLTSLLLITRLVDELSEGGALGPALLRAAAWLRTLTAEQALAHLDHLVERVSELGPAGREAVERVAGRLDEHRAWLGRLSPSDRPFGSLLDWAAFHVHSVAT